MYKIKSVEDLHKLIQEYANLKKLVSCPICLDIVKNPIQIGCKHTFCSDCLKTFESFVDETSSTKSIVCPMCRSAVTRRQRVSHLRTNNVSQFLSGVGRKLKELLGDDFSEYITLDNLRLKFEAPNKKTIQKNDHSLFEKTTSSSADIIPSSIQRPDPNVRKSARKPKSKNTTPIKFTPKKEQTSTSKRGRPTKKDQASALKNNQTTVTDLKVIQPVAVSSKPEIHVKDAFDRLMESAINNPFFKSKPPPKRTYSNKRKKKPRPPTVETKIFENDENRVKILQWLNDNRNNFDRLTQTQEIYSDSQKSFDIDSVSQIHTTKYNQAIQSPMKNICKVLRVTYEKYRRRTRSLDIQVRKTKIKNQLERYSIAGESPSLENIDIEEVESEPDEEIEQIMANPTEAMAILDMMEEEYLNSIDSEMLKGLENQNVNVHEGGEKNYANRKSTEKKKGNIKEKSKKGSKEKDNSNKHDFHKNEGSDMKGEELQLNQKPTVLGTHGTKENLLIDSNADSKQGTSSGWTRMKQTEKTIEKKSKRRTLQYSLRKSNQNEPENIRRDTNMDSSLQKENLTPEETIEKKDSKSDTINVEGENTTNISNKNMSLHNEKITDQKLGKDNNKENGGAIVVSESSNSVPVINISEFISDESASETFRTRRKGNLIPPRREIPKENETNKRKELESSRQTKTDDEMSLIEKTVDMITNENRDEEIFFVPTQKVNKSAENIEKTAQSHDEPNFEDMFARCLKEFENIKTIKNKISSSVPGGCNISVTSEKFDNNYLTLIPHVDELQVHLTKIKNILNENSRNLGESKNDAVDFETSAMDIDEEIGENVVNRNSILMDRTPATFNNNFLIGTTRTISLEYEEKAVQTNSPPKQKSQKVQTRNNSTVEYMERYIQTDTQDNPRGFNISSNEEFKTQVNCHVEVQTTDLCCPKCNHNINEIFIEPLQSNTTGSKTPSDVLIDDVELIRALNEKYAFQDEIDALQAGPSRVTSKNNQKLSLSTKQQASTTEENNRRSAAHESNKMAVCSQNSQSKSGKSENSGKIKPANIRNTAIFGKSSSESSSASQKSTTNVENLICNANSSEGSEIIFTLPSQRRVTASRRLTYIQDDLKKKFKRIRSPSSDDSDSDIDKTVKRLKTADFNNSEVEVAKEGSGNVEEEPPTKKRKDDDSMTFSIEGDDFNYDEYLERILKKYDDPPGSSKAPSVQRVQNRDKDIIDKCDRVISGISRLKGSETNKSFKQKASKLSTSKENTSPSSGRREKLPPNKSSTESDPFSTSLFTNVENLHELSKEMPQRESRMLTSSHTDENKDKPSSGKASIDLLMEEFNNEMVAPDSDADEEVCNITVSMENQPEITPRKGTSAPMLITTDDGEVDDFREIDTQSTNSEELFNTDGDDDIVETTPQKVKPNLSQRLLSQVAQNSFENIVLPPPQDSPDIVYTESFIASNTLPPPPEFQDCEEVEEEETEGTVVQGTEDVSQHIRGVEKIRPTAHQTKGILATCFKVVNLPLLNRNVNVKTSTQNQDVSQRINLPQDIDLSPIQKAKSFNPIEITQNSKFSPLTVISVKPTAPNPNFCMSTPKQKSILSYVKASEEKSTSSCASLLTLDNTIVNKKPLIACTRLPKDQVIAISSLTNKKLATYSNSFTSSVTHMIVCVNEKNHLKDHTIKYVSAVAAGIWVLNFSWVQECLKQNRIVPEEPFEVLDVSGIPGPKQSRLTRTTHPLFKGYKIFAAPPFVSTTQKDVENVVTLLGGHVVSKPDDLLQRDGFICLIVTEARATQDFELYETWLEMLKIVTVDIEWLSRSVGQYKLLSLRPFALCSDDTITQLGYPEELTINLSFSFSQGIYSNA